MDKEITIFQPFGADFYVWGWKVEIPPTFPAPNEPYTLTFYPDEVSINQDLFETLAGARYD